MELYLRYSLLKKYPRQLSFSHQTDWTNIFFSVHKSITSFMNYYFILFERAYAIHKSQRKVTGMIKEIACALLKPMRPAS